MRTESPSLCSWMRAPSIFHSNATSPPSCVERFADVRSGLRQHRRDRRQRLRAGTARAMRRPRSARRARPRRDSSHTSPRAGFARPVRRPRHAIASTMTPSSAPCRSSPTSSRIRNSCSSRVARANRSCSACGAPRRGARAANRRDVRQASVDVCDRQRRPSTATPPSSLALRKAGIADAEAALRDFARQIMHGGVDLARLDGAQARRELADLGQPRGRCPYALRDGDQVCEQAHDGDCRLERMPKVPKQRSAGGFCRWCGCRSPASPRGCWSSASRRSTSRTSLQHLSAVPTADHDRGAAVRCRCLRDGRFVRRHRSPARERPQPAPAGIPHGRDRQSARPRHRRRDGQRRRAALSHVRARRAVAQAGRRSHPAGRDAVRVRRRLADRSVVAAAPERSEPRVSVAVRRGDCVRRARPREGRRLARIRRDAQGSRSRSAANRSACPRCATRWCRSRSAWCRSR